LTDLLTLAFGQSLLEHGEAAVKWQFARTDFNGDGIDDIFWRHWLNGPVSNWLGNASGGFTVNDAQAYVPLGLYGDDGGTVLWEILGAGDFNGDGRSDVLWISHKSELSTWLGTSTGGWTVNDAAALTAPHPEIERQAIGDFNGDGRDDILWLSDSGQLSTWSGTLAGSFLQNASFAIRPASWQIIGAGDFNGDDRDDILWFNFGTRTVSNWLSTGSGFTQNDANAMAQVGNWYVTGIGDFNGDGFDDLLWRHPTGALSNWLGNASGGFTVNDASAYVVVSPDWHVQSVGDYNGDGRDDILWRNENSYHLSNWLATSSGGFVNNDANAYSVVPSWWVTFPDWTDWD
jgi:hypothetical protein